MDTFMCKTVYKCGILFHKLEGKLEKQKENLRQYYLKLKQQFENGRNKNKQQKPNSNTETVKDDTNDVENTKSEE